MFLDCLDKLVKLISRADIVTLANKCGTLMASVVHRIPLFTTEFINKLISCTYSFVFKIYLLHYMSWFDYCLLKRLVIFTNNEEALKVFNHFVSLLDYSKAVRSSNIPEVSQLIIPLDNSQHSLLATMHVKSIDELTLQKLLNIKESLMSCLELSDYAIQLSAIHKNANCIYWLIPNIVRPLVEDKLSQNLFNKEFFNIKLLDKISLQQNNFNFFQMNLDDPQQV